ncbi:MAG: nucleotidyltransferase domain-containing protein [Candidatus Omnitrophica bacterium]|nr:nucleotidyltransferase domain-containing protein [Candidatus Omnitrophota bacterium]
MINNLKAAIPPVNQECLANLCRNWRVTELSLFGSSVSGGLRADSDVDLLVSFAEGARWDLFDHLELKEELEILFGRKVDLLTRSSVENSENPIRRSSILEQARPIYVER